jgi:tRNA (guanosine-2'-O-)-methyltransferase
VSRVLGGTELKRLHRHWRRRTDGRVALVLEDVQNPFNVGAIVRTAAAFSVDHLWLVGATPDLGGPKVAKTALGTQRYLTWTACADVDEAAALARGDGLAVVGVELAEGAVPIHEAVLGPEVALVLGHEDRGLTPRALAACDEVAYVPQLGKVGSLNVATAAALAIYEARRRSFPPNSPTSSTLPPTQPA